MKDRLQPRVAEQSGEPHVVGEGFESFCFPCYYPHHYDESQMFLFQAETCAPRFGKQ